MNIMLNNLIDRHCTGSIPNFDKVRFRLFILFVDPLGPCMSLISHYFTTGLKQQEYENIADPIEQGYLCVQHLPYFAKVSRYTISIRNILAHNQHLSMVLLNACSEALCELYNKATTSLYIMESIITELIIIYRVITGNDVCLHTMNSIDLSHSVNLPQHNLPSAKIDTLENIKKKPELKDRLKGTRIKILSGKWQNKTATFNSWSGTSSYITIDGEGKKLVSTRAMIEYHL